MTLFLHELRTEQKLFWRNREAAFFTFLLPIIFFLIFGSIYGDEIMTKERMRAAPFLEAGMIGYGVAATCFAGLGIMIVVRRESGVLKRIRATPLPPATYYIFAKADANGVVSESFENNNARWRNIQIGGDLIISSMEAAIVDKQVTYDFARMMDDATEVSTSGFGRAMIERM